MRVSNTMSVEAVLTITSAMVGTIYMKRFVPVAENTHQYRPLFIYIFKCCAMRLYVIALFAGSVFAIKEIGLVQGRQINKQKYLFILWYF